MLPSRCGSRAARTLLFLLLLIRLLGSEPEIASAGPLPGAGCDDQESLWWDGFDLLVSDGSISVAVPYRDGLAVGGSFSRIGGIAASNIAYWNGSSWEALGSGAPRQVTALATVGDSLAVGAEVYSWEGNWRSSVAFWDGSDWNSTARLEDPPRVLAVYQGRLIAGGQFRLPGRSAARSVIALADSTWEPLGFGPDGVVKDLEVFDGKLIAGGSFTYADDIAVNNVAAWDGSSWRPLAGGIAGSTVNALTVHEGDLIAGGFFRDAGEPGLEGIARWNGARWEAVGAGMPGAVQDLTLHDRRLVAAVDDLEFFTGMKNAVWSWDGSQWTALDQEPLHRVHTLASLGSVLVACGSFIQPGEPDAVDIAAWDGAEWRGLGPPVAGYGLLALEYGRVLALMVDGEGVIAAGNFDFAGSSAGLVPAHSIARWNGAGWETFGPDPQQVYAVARFRGDLIAAGLIVTDQGYWRIARWDGSAWKSLDEGISGFVSALATFRNKLYAVGWLSIAGGSNEPIVEWDGTSWHSIEPPPGLLSRIGELAVDENRLIVAGSGGRGTHVMTWDGTQWHELPSVPGYVDALGIYQTRVVLGGSFAASGGSSLVVWNGETWDPLGEDLRGTVSAIGVHGGDLIVGGWLRVVNEPASVARWTGTEWCGLGGTGAYVDALASAGNHLYAGGHFSSMAGQPSYLIARWDGTPSPAPAPAPRAIVLEPNRPNPFRSSTALSFTLASAARIHLALYDLSGRQVATLVDGWREAGTHWFAWDAHDEEGSRVRPGVYFMRLSAHGRSEQTRRIVLLE